MPFFRDPDTQLDLFYTWTPSQASDQEINIIFIHGLGSSHSFFASVVPDLVDRGFSCLTFDTPGAGLSPSTSHVKTPSDIAHCASALIEDLGLIPERTLIAGHSMGGLIACELALLQLQDTYIPGVILIGPVHPSESLRDIFSERINLVYECGLEPLADVIPHKATGSGATPVQKAFIRSLIFSQRPHNYVAHCRLIVDAIAPEYYKINCPLLLLAGDEDLTCSPDVWGPIVDSWRHESKSIATLNQCGHWHCIEAPEQLCNEITQWASELGITD